MTSSHSASVTSTTGLSSARPALFTKRSMSPSSVVARANAALMLSGERRSSAMATVLRSLISDSASVSFSASALNSGQREVIALPRQRDGDGAAKPRRTSSDQCASSFTHAPSLMLAITRFGELHVRDTGGEIGPHRRALDDVPQKVLPADPIGILERPGVRHLACQVAR